MIFRPDLRPDLRMAEDRDRAAIRDLHTASWRAAYAHAVPATALGASLEDEMARRWDWLPKDVLLAESEGRIIGFARLMHHGGWPYLDNLHVAPDSHGQGIGRALMQGVGAMLVGRGAGRLWLTVLGSNHGARAFYRAMGGVEGATMREFLMGQPVKTYPLIWMRPSLLRGPAR